MDILCASEVVSNTVGQGKVIANAIDSQCVITAVSRLSAGICMGLGAIGSAIGQGFIGAKTIESSARQPDMHQILQTKMYIANAMAETTALYCLILCMALLFS